MSYSKVKRNRRSIYKILDYLLKNKNTVSVLCSILLSLSTLIFLLTRLWVLYSVIFSVIGLLWGLYVEKKARLVDACIFSISMLVCLVAFIFVIFNSWSIGLTEIHPHKIMLKVKNGKKLTKKVINLIKT